MEKDLFRAKSTLQTIDAVNGMFETARRLDAGMVRGLAAVFEAMGRLKPGTVEAIGRLLEELG